MNTNKDVSDLKRFRNADGIETIVFNKTDRFKRTALKTNPDVRRSYGHKDAASDCVTDRLMTNKIVWESQRSRPTSALISQNPERKISTGDQSSNKGKLSDYLPSSKHLVETMEKVFSGGERASNDHLLNSKIIRNNLFGSSQRSAVRALSQDRMTRSQHIPKPFANIKDAMLDQPLLYSTNSKKLLNHMNSTQKEMGFLKQIQHMKQDFGKFMQRRKVLS